MSSVLGCDGKVMSPQAYQKQQQKESIQPDATQPAIKSEALNTTGNRGTALNVSA